MCVKDVQVLHPEGVYADNERLTAENLKLRAALQGLYDFLPRYSCKSLEPDGCPVCIARAALRGE